MGLSACQNDGTAKIPQNDQAKPYDSTLYDGVTIKFDATTYDFGRVYEGEKVTWHFKFKNLGNKSLVLTNVNVSCGCTIADYSTEPVAPGNEGEISVVFDSEGKNGYQYKTVSVESNGEPKSIELSIKAEIVKK